MQFAHRRSRLTTCRRGERLGRMHSLPSDSCPLPPRRGLTLVELLITITIIAILASMILGVASVAGETARESHTRHMITRLHTLLMQHLDTYKTRRVKLNPQIETLIQNDSSLNTAAKKGKARAAARLYALREMMLMEIPDRWSDITLGSVPGDVNNPIYIDVSGSSSAARRTILSSVYLRRYLPLIAKVNSLSGAERDAALKALIDNQGAECLYLIVTIACGDGEARTLFHDSNIGDTDGDGAPEFLDGWGHPINFIRWAPGFDSEIQLNANDFSGGPSSSEWLASAASDHDSYDLFRSEPAAFRLVPLIYSGGRDETFGIWVATGHVTWPMAGALPVLSPYSKVTDPDTGNINYLGTAVDETATDNIHNHLLGKRR